MKQKNAAIASEPQAKTQPLRGKDGVYKRGKTWKAVVEYPPDPVTKMRKRVWLSGFKTREEAIEARDKARYNVRSGIDVAPQKLSVCDLLTRWLENSRTRIGAKTYQEYESLVSRYIYPRIGSVQITKLRPLHIEAMYCDLMTKGRKNGKGGLSGTSVRHVHGLLNTVLEWAVRMRIVSHNVMKSVIPPNRARPDVEALTDDEIVKVLDEAKGSRWETAIKLALSTGMRRGEIGAITWGSIDLESKTITIRAALSETKAGVTVKTTKTGRTRTVPLAPLAIDALKERRQQYAAERLAAGPGYLDEGYIIADPLGRLYAPSALSDAFRKIAKQAGVKKRLHDTRHTFATILIGSGVDVRTTADLLGHSTPTVTLSIYSHQILGHKEDAVAKVGERLQAAIAGRKNA